MHIAQQRRWVAKTALKQHYLRLPAGRAFGDPLTDHALDTIELHASHDRTNIDRLVERKANSQSVHALANLGDQILGNAFLHQQARSRTADLPLVEPDAIDQSLDRTIQVGVVEDDEWGLPSQ